MASRAVGVLRRCCGYAPRLRVAAPHVRAPLRPLILSYNTSACRFASYDVRAVASREDKVLQALRHVVDPVFDKDIVSLGYVKNLNAATDEISFNLQLASPAHPHKEELQRLARTAVAAAGIPGVTTDDSVTVPVTTLPRRASAGTDAAKGSRRVANIIAVSSCKGGTGKSTVTVNLAYTLAATGARVGVLDADLYGPSLPALISPEDTRVFKHEDDGTINPLVYHGVKAMSYGYVAPKDKKTGKRGGALVRGPIASNITQQLATFTDWGELDYLLVDLPPGTGDINITLCQQLQVAAAVVVTTPHKLSYIDVIKGIDMFDNLKVPTLALVENMAYFECEHGTKYYPFGTSCKPTLVNTYGFRAAESFPLHRDLAVAAETGCPLVVSEPDHPISQQYKQLADSFVTELLRLQSRAAGAGTTSVVWDAQKGLIAVRQFSADGAREDYLDPVMLRRNCQCAACVDEYTGDALLDPSSVPSDVVPTSVQVKGNYAVGITWSDGHTSSIYKYTSLQELVDQTSS